jgi:hypothetical protein
MTEHSKETVPGRLGAVPCRAEEFGRWDRVLLQHERAFLSRTMATQAAFLKPEDKDAIMHDLQDIDYFLARSGSAQLVKTPGYEDIGNSTAIELWPASEGPIPPSQR